jgi:hypothetical protein
VSVNFKTVVFGKGIFVAVAGESTTSVSSTDGITWTVRTLPSAPDWVGLAYGNGVFVATGAYFGSSNASIYSTDGITWTATTMPNTAAWESVAYGSNVFVAVGFGYGGGKASSTNGITWTIRTIPEIKRIGYSNTESSNFIAYNNSIPGNSTVTIKAGYTLPASGGIRVTSTNGTSTFSTFGAEIS